MNIIVLHQPFPQGNFKVNEFAANFFKNQGHNVYLVEQLNGIPASDEFANQLKSVNPDVIYFEMLDHQSFKSLEQIDCKKVLIYCSKGILPNYTEIEKYYKKWFTHMYTNSRELCKYFKTKNIPVDFFEYYFSCLLDEEMIFNQKYNHECCYLGMGSTRLTDPTFHLEQKLFFDGLPSIDFKIYGPHWPSSHYYGGILPPNDIGSLYKSSKSAIGLLSTGQREHGFVNNRYTEIMYSECPILSLNYDTIDWYGAEKYINFVKDKQDLIDKIKDISNTPEKYKDKSLKAKDFIIDKTNTWFEKFNNLVGL